MGIFLGVLFSLLIEVEISTLNIGGTISGAVP